MGVSIHSIVDTTILLILEIIYQVDRCNQTVIVIMHEKAHLKPQETMLV